MARFPATWVLVADSARARIFSWSDFPGPLVEEQDLVNPEGRRKDRDLASDRPGVTYSSRGQSAHRMSGGSMADGVADGFARSVVETLKLGLDDNRCERLVLVAPPEFLGRLRSHLDKRTEKAVVESLANDLSRESAQTILARLPRLNNL